MKKSIAIIAGLLLSTTGAWAAGTQDNTAGLLDTLNNSDLVLLTDAEMAETRGKHLTITNGSESWEHPVSAFHGTLTISPRQGASLSKEMLVP